MAQFDLSIDTKQFLKELFESHKLDKLERKLDRVLNKLDEQETIMANGRAEVLAQLETVKAGVGKIGTDLAVFVAELQAAIAAGQDLTDIVASVSDVATRLQAVDDTIPERPAPVE